MVSKPVSEVGQLFDEAYSGNGLTAREANEVMKRFDGNDVLRIHAKLHLTYATDAGFSYRGQRLVKYDMNGNRLNGEFYASPEPGSMELDADIYVDRGMVEVYIDGGLYSYSMKRDVKSTNPEGYVFWGNQLELKNLAVYTVKSIWDNGRHCQLPGI